MLESLLLIASFSSSFVSLIFCCLGNCLTKFRTCRNVSDILRSVFIVRFKSKYTKSRLNMMHQSLQVTLNGLALWRYFVFRQPRTLVE